MNTLDSNQVVLLGLKAAFARTCADSSYDLKAVDTQTLYDKLEQVCRGEYPGQVFPSLYSVDKVLGNSVKQQEFQKRFFENFADFCYRTASAGAGPIGQAAVSCK